MAAAAAERPSTAAAASATARRRSSVLLPGVGRRGSFAELLVVGDDPSGAPASLPLTDLVERTGLGWYQVRALLPLVGILISEGAELLVTSAVAAGLQLEWGLTDQQKAGLSSAAFLGLALGTWLSGAVADTLGRRAAILASYCGMAVFGALSSQAPGFSSMVGLRLANGTACGLGLPACFVMLSELFPKRYRSASYAVVTTSIALGELYVGLGLCIWMPDLMHGNWRAVTVWAALPCVFFFAASLGLLCESPYWLSVRGRVHEARAILLEMARLNGTLQEVESLAATCTGPEAPPTERGHGASFLAMLGSLVFNGRLLANILLCAALCIIGNLLTFGMSYFWPQAIRSGAMTAAGDPALCLMAIRAWGVLVCMAVLAATSSPLGHRWVIAGAGWMAAAGLACCRAQLLGGGGGHLLLAGGASLVCAGLFYSSVLTMTSESFPTEVRALGSGTCITIGRLGSIGSPVLIEALGLQRFLTVAISAALAAAIFVLPLRETKGLPLDDFCEEVPRRLGVGPKGGLEGDALRLAQALQASPHYGAAGHAVAEKGTADTV